MIIPRPLLSKQILTPKHWKPCSSLRPVVVEPYEQQDDIDGYPDKNIPRKNSEFMKARDVGPRFAQPGSFEHEYGTRWKQLHELYKQKEDALKREMAMEEEKLEAQMEFARYEHETELLRDRERNFTWQLFRALIVIFFFSTCLDVTELRSREADRERQKREWELKERQAEEQRTREEEMRRRQQEEMTVRIKRQEEELHRRQQENNLFMQVKFGQVAYSFIVEIYWNSELAFLTEQHFSFRNKPCVAAAAEAG